MSDKCPNCGSESRDFRGITGMLGAICFDEWHDKAPVLDDKDKRIAELEVEIVRLSASFLKINDIVKQVFELSEGGADD